MQEYFSVQLNTIYHVYYMEEVTKMGGTKIFVVQLKELIKMAIFGLIGISLIIMLIYFFIPKDKTDSASAIYNAGTYSSEVVLHNSPVNILVTVSETEITAIELKNMAEVQEVFYPLFQPTIETLSKEIIEKQSLNISVSSDTQFTSHVILSAVNSALEKAIVH